MFKTLNSETEKEILNRIDKEENKTKKEIKLNDIKSNSTIENNKYILAGINPEEKESFYSDLSLNTEEVKKRRKEKESNNKSNKKVFYNEELENEYEFQSKKEYSPFSFISKKIAYNLSSNQQEEEEKNEQRVERLLNIKRTEIIKKTSYSNLNSNNYSREYEKDVINSNLSFRVFKDLESWRDLMV